MEIELKKPIYIGLFMVTLATLMLEILLTRIFSVTMWYHYAFLAISIAMFGMTVGAVKVYLFPNFFKQQLTNYHLSLSALLFSISSIISIFMHVFMPVTENSAIFKVIYITLNFVSISVPFLCSGICVCLALSRFPKNVGKLYAADLAGAAVGCIAVKYALDLTDGPTAVILVALFASLGALFFAYCTDSKKTKSALLAVCLSLFIFFIINSYLVTNQTPFLKLTWAKGKQEDKYLYEKWNSYSRIKVMGEPEKLRPPINWEGLSSNYPSDKKIRQIYLTIDGNAGTALTHYDGNLKDLAFLDYDVSSLVHYLRPDSKVFIIGAGGGKDVLAALKFHQKSVLAVEINENIIKTLNELYGEFTGHLDKLPKVVFVNDEARSYILREKQKFDIIQASLIDTWAATVAGAYTMTENSLYTLEAWDVFLNHLNNNGILTFTRFYNLNDPAEIYRLTSLASKSIKRIGLHDPRNNIVIVRNVPAQSPFGLGTILVSKMPFTKKDLDTIDDISRRMNFEVVLSSRSAMDPILADIASDKNTDAMINELAIDITPPTYDKPFFFQTTRFSDLHKATFIRNNSILTLATLLLIIPCLSYFFIISPIRGATGKIKYRNVGPFMVYFAAIGFGFILVEISQIQRLTIFLGHPAYSLSVVLFTLLLSSGMGSYTTKTNSILNVYRTSINRLFLLVLSLFIFGLFTPYVTSEFQSSTIFIRVILAITIISPIGFFMGMAFPLGMRALSVKASSLSPLLWGVNGAASVYGSILAVAIALNSGISASFWLGFVCYLISFVLFSFGFGRTVLTDSA